MDMHQSGVTAGTSGRSQMCEICGYESAVIDSDAHQMGGTFGEWLNGDTCCYLGSCTCLLTKGRAFC